MTLCDSTQCGQNPNLVRCVHLCGGGHCQKRLALEGSMHAILQVLSLSLFEVKPLAELLGAELLNDEAGEPEAQFCLFPEISGQ